MGNSYFLSEFRDSFYPRKLQHTPISHTPGNPPTQLWKDSLYNLFGKACSGCVPVRCVETTLDSNFGGLCCAPKHLQKSWQIKIPRNRWADLHETPEWPLTAEPKHFGAERKMILLLKGWSFNWYQFLRFFLGVFWDIPDGFQQLEDVGGFVRIWTECLICQYVKKRHPIQNPAKKTNRCLVSVSSLLLERLHP